MKQAACIAEEEPSVDDEFVLTKSNELNAILLTSDKGFGELIFNRRLSSNGVILIRLEGLTQKEKIEVVLNAINNIHEEMFKAFTVISKKHIRVRKLN